MAHASVYCEGPSRCDLLLHCLPVPHSADLPRGHHIGLAGSFLSGELLGAAQKG